MLARLPEFRLSLLGKELTPCNSQRSGSYVWPNPLLRQTYPFHRLVLQIKTLSDKSS
jgi:hypothetical protein